jgi:glycosyltransferase involved in cell wall biosynthesis
MKLAIIEPVGGHGGMNYYDMGLALALAKRGVSVTWYTCDKTVETSTEEVEIVKYFTKIYGAEARIIRFFRFLFALLRSLVDCSHRKISIVHYHFFGIGLLEYVMCFLAKMFAFKICVTLHDVESFSDKQIGFFAKGVFGRVDKFIVHNRVSESELVIAGTSLGFDPSVYVIPHGNYCAVVENIGRESGRKAIGIGIDDLVVLFFGQIKVVKGLDVLLAAMPLIRDQCQSIKLIVAGKVWKDDFSVYQELINANNLHNIVRLDIRYIPDAEVDAYYSAADCVVLPYRKIYQSGVLLMAMSYGLPVLVSDLAGMIEVVSDGETGFVFKTGDHVDLANKLMEIIEDSALRVRVGSSAQQLMLDEYSWDSVAGKTKSVFEELL